MGTCSAAPATRGHRRRSPGASAATAQGTRRCCGAAPDRWWTACHVIPATVRRSRRRSSARGGSPRGEAAGPRGPPLPDQKVRRGRLPARCASMQASSSIVMRNARTVRVSLAGIQHLNRCMSSMPPIQWGSSPGGCFGGGGTNRLGGTLLAAGARRSSRTASVLQRGSLVGVPLGSRRGSVLLDGPSAMAALQVPPFLLSSSSLAGPAPFCPVSSRLVSPDPDIIIQAPGWVYCGFSRLMSTTQHC